MRLSAMKESQLRNVKKHAQAVENYSHSFTMSLLASPLSQAMLSPDVLRTHAIATEDVMTVMPTNHELSKRNMRPCGRCAERRKKVSELIARYLLNLTIN